jgi:hypothetical protein
MPSVVSPFEYALYWVVAAGFGIAFLGLLIYNLIRRK